MTPLISSAKHWEWNFCEAPSIYLLVQILGNRVVVSQNLIGPLSNSKYTYLRRKFISNNNNNTTTMNIQDMSYISFKMADCSLK